MDCRKLAFAHYEPMCAHCGFAIPAVLNVAHIDGDRQNNDLENLVVLCPTCNRMYDLELIPTEVVKRMRDHHAVANWSKLEKRARKKAALTRKRREAAKKAVETRRRRQQGRAR
ncbi:MAG: hypothetical protein GTN62_08440 [Gemmatimonadales bacterium]|nr:hypothetical protein [Gemmatimonadales bacterium]NIN50126.1 hypothetical protein [Gemmatimonadales bacterium]NIP07590.1 hypothetical protein [Gemmatimonadales bacterium]NIR01742.1 hypothetical protein [Gemmatimonadales bacterium]NIS65645.1 hypothetical protein [Gemmatimonadales bacterium]